MNVSILRDEIIERINNYGYYSVCKDDNTWIEVYKDEEDNNTIKVRVKWKGWWDSDVYSLYSHDVNNYDRTSFEF